MNLNEVNQVVTVVVPATEVDMREESGRSKRKRVTRQLALNGCLCGLILDGRSVVHWRVSSNVKKPDVRVGKYTVMDADRFIRLTLYV